MDQQPLEILVVEVGGRRHGLPAADVEELLRMVALTPLPGAPAPVEGVLNLRGRVVPVVPLRERLGLTAKEADPGDHLVVVQAGGRRVALRVDRAIDLVRVEPGSAEPAAGPAAWVARLGDGLVPVHAVDALVAAAAAGVGG